MPETLSSSAERRVAPVTPEASESPFTETVIIGAGPAGLAVGACLQRAGRSFVILEQAPIVGPCWARMYAGLQLNTDKSYSALPFFPFPRDYPRYPTSRDMAAYLAAYARHFGLTPHFGQRVATARRDNGNWRIHTLDRVYASANLVIATGNSQEPYWPQWPDMDRFKGSLLHSADFPGGEAYNGRSVLVVGLGNSGGDIALNLYRHGASVSLAVRGPLNIVPRDVMGINVLRLLEKIERVPTVLSDVLRGKLLERLTVDLPQLGLRKPPYDAITQANRRHKLPLIDKGTVALVKKGSIPVYPGVAGFFPEGVLFADGRARAFDAVILATGYRPGVDAVLGTAPQIDTRPGLPVTRAVQTGLPGLYFCGFRVSAGGILRSIGQEAMAIGRLIAGQAGA